MGCVPNFKISSIVIWEKFKLDIQSIQYIGACSQVATGGAQGEVRRLQPTDEEIHSRPRHNRLP